MLRRNGRTELTQKTFIFRRLIYAVIFLTGFVGGTARSQENQTCLECHSDPSLIGTCGGKEISVTVDLKILSASVHASLDCIACHQDLAGAALPHTEVLKSVDCGACHGDVKGMDRLTQAHEFNMGFCVQCHRDNNVSHDCLMCHR